MKRVDFRRVFIFSSLTALVVIYTILWIRMINDPADRTGSDFISAYTGGRVADMWGPENVYNLEYQQRVQTSVVGFELAPGQVLMFNHPPYLVPLLAVLMDENYILSLIRYALVMAALYTAALVTAWCLFRLEGWQRGTSALAVAGLGTFFPLFISLVNTQDTALMVLGGVLLLLGILTGRDWLAGLGLALTTVRPHISILLAIPFLFRRRWVFAWFAAGAVVLAIVSLLAVGPAGIQAYFLLLLTAAGGQFYGMQEGAMVNLVGFLSRFAPGLGSNALHWIGWAFYIGSLIGLCVLWARSREIGPKQIGLAVVLAVFAVPHLHYHDLTLLGVALIATLPGLVCEKYLGERQACLAPLSISLALLLSSLVPGLQYNFPYLLMCLLILALWMPGRLLFMMPKQQDIR
jgi:hypothetical protein